MRPQNKLFGVLVFTVIPGIGAALTYPGYQAADNVFALAVGIIAFGIAIKGAHRELAMQSS
jgi:hypothetical protein